MEFKKKKKYRLMLPVILGYGLNQSFSTYLILQYIHFLIKKAVEVYQISWGWTLINEYYLFNY